MDQHHLKAAIDTARARGRKLGRSAVERAREQAESRDLDIQAFERSALGAKAAGAAKVSTLADRASEHPRGRRAADFTSGLAQRAALLPGLTVVSDAIQARYDLRHQVARLADDPRSLQELIWTATAVREVETALMRYRRVRVTQAGVRLLLGDGTSAVLQLSARLAGRLASGQSVPPVEVLLRSAFGLAVARLRRDPTDAEAHYCLARLYLLTGDPGAASLSARAAVRTATAATTRGDAFTALAYAGLSSGQPDSARKAAELALGSGTTTANLVLAELVASESGPVVEQNSKAAEHRRAVRDEDHGRYFGPRPSTGSVAKSVWQQQKEKTRALLDQTRQAYDTRVGPAGNNHNEGKEGSTDVR
ncbi:MAG: tetratricopeptide repeat protein [Acidimicrobiales bacterium]